MTIDKELNKLKKDELISIITNTLSIQDIKLELNKEYIRKAELEEMEASNIGEWLMTYDSMKLQNIGMIVNKKEKQIKYLTLAGKYYDKGYAILNTKYIKEK